jgi:regulator of protease activity HflC (stomatin/prohibitin superfamily)
MRTRTAIAPALALSCLPLGACHGIVQPGHLGLLFKPSGGLQTHVLTPGRYYVGPFGHIDDFDVTYSTRTEELQTVSAEDLPLSLRCSISFRPIVEELYSLDVEIGQNYYQEVIGPQFRTATRGVFAMHSYQDLQRNNAKIENEIRVEVQRRIAGKHVEVSGITLEQVHYAPEISDSIRAKLIGEQEAIRLKVATDSQAAQRKKELEYQAERAKLEAEAELLKKQHEHALAQEQAAIDKLKAETEAQTRIIAARATAEEKRAEAVSLTPLMVLMKGYEALAQLAGPGTHIMLGDWSKVPNFLMPAGLVPGGGGHVATAAAPPATK